MATLLPAEPTGQSSRMSTEIAVPVSTAWPLILAFGFTLLFAGLLTSASVSVLGAVLAIAGCVGWLREVFPHEHEEVVPVVPEDVSVATERQSSNGCQSLLNKCARGFRLKPIPFRLA